MGRIRKSGGYRKLATFQMATIIYDATVWFCEKFLDPRSRTKNRKECRPPVLGLLSLSRL